VREKLSPPHHHPCRILTLARPRPRCEKRCDAREKEEEEGLRASEGLMRWSAAE
jgi:hypothetical protein